MLFLIEFRLDFLSGSPRSVSRRVTTLNQEFLGNPMKRQSIIETFFHKLGEPGHGLGRRVGKYIDGEPPPVGLDHDALAGLVGRTGLKFVRLGTRGTVRFVRRGGRDGGGAEENSAEKQWGKPWQAVKQCHGSYFSFSTIVTVISIRSLGKSFAPRAALTILSATSIPRMTSPKAVYCLSRKLESFTTMKNCDPALSG